MAGFLISSGSLGGERNNLGGGERTMFCLQFVAQSSSVCLSVLSICLGRLSD